MSSRGWAVSDDLPTAAVVVVAVLLLGWLALLVVELGQRERHGKLIVLSGALCAALTAAAVLRPVRVTTHGSLVGPRVLVLFDESRRLLLPAEGSETRRARGVKALKKAVEHFSDARLATFGFSEGQPRPLALDAIERGERFAPRSDLVAGLSAVSQPGERPDAVVVLSDGRLTRPAAGGDEAALRRAVDIGVPIHTVRLAEQAPRDASIRAVRAAGAAVAHQPLGLEVEIGCAGGLDCKNVPLSVRELRYGVEPALLASGVAKVEDDVGRVELKITLERAGTRVVEIAMEAPEGDQIPENNSRILTFTVARERVRLLHVAGRPTYDVRALRMWLKSDESVDLVAFFILRTDEDTTGAGHESELSLIPFPVEQLFTEHLPSFDAVMLQDIDAREYKLERHLGALGRYVEAGGGLIMVGGPSAFIGGGYAGSDLERVLPVSLPENERPFDTVEFVPTYTESGRAAPVLAPLRDLLAEELPSMPGANTLGPAREGALVLWQHPRRRAGEQPMPVLALGEAGDGRAIALGVDGTHTLSFGELGARVAGRAFGALWDGLLGWLMRDPRYEAARMELIGECISGEPAKLRLVRVTGAAGDVELVLERLGGGVGEPIKKRVSAPESGPVEIDLGKLEPGGYSARAHVGKAPATRYDFACERAGEAWSDSRPDAERLQQVSRVSGGRSVDADEIEKLPLPEPTVIAAERHVTPLLPAWLWALGAAMMLGSHWLVRRRGGLA